MTTSSSHVLTRFRAVALAVSVLLLLAPGQPATAAATADQNLRLSAYGDVEVGQTDIIHGYTRDRDSDTTVTMKLQYVNPGGTKWKSLSTKTFTANKVGTWKVKFHKTGTFKLRLKATVNGATTVSAVRSHTVLPAYVARRTSSVYLRGKAHREFQRRLCHAMYEGMAELSSFSYPSVSAIMKAYTVMGSSRDCDQISTAQSMRNALYAGLFDYGLTRGRDAAADAMWGKWMNRVLAGVRIDKNSGELLKGAWNKFVLAQISAYYDAAEACIHSRTGLFERAACFDNGYLSRLTDSLL